MKKIIFSIVIILVIFFICFVLFDDKDFCLDTGYCKTGLKIQTEFGLVEINKENCLNHNWQWDDKNKYCNIKQIKINEQ